MSIKIFHYTTSYSRLSVGILDRLESLASVDLSFHPFVITTSSSPKVSKYNYIRFRCLPKNVILIFIFLACSILNKQPFSNDKLFVVRYSPTAVYLWPIILLMPFVIWEFHGLPIHETYNRKHLTIRNFLLGIEKKLFSIYPRRYTAVTRQIASFIEENYNPKQVVLCPNPTGFRNYRQKAISLIKNNISSGPVPIKSSYSQNLKILFLASNLSQPWQGLDIASYTLKCFCNIYPDIKITFCVFGDNIPSYLSNQIKADSNSTPNYKIHLSPAIFTLDQNFFQHYDFSLAPCGLSRKNLTSSSSLKTRTCLTNGVPVVSNYPDDAFNYTNTPSASLNKTLYFFRYDNLDEFSSILFHILRSKLMYPITFNVRVFLFAKKFLDITPSSLVSEFV